MPIVTMPDGTQVQFPDDMPAETIRGLIAEKFPDAVAQQTAPAQGVGGPQRPGIDIALNADGTLGAPIGSAAPQPGGPLRDIGDAAMEFASPVLDALGGRNARPFQAMGQGAARAALDTATLPIEAADLVYNLGAGALNLPGYANQYLNDQPLDGFFPYLGSPTELLADEFSQGAESLGLPVRDPEEMSPRERMLYEATRFGVGAGGQGGALRSIASRRTPSDMPRFADPLIKPYEGPSAVPTIARDTAAGVGAGTGLATYDQTVGESEDRGLLGDLGSLIAMAIGGTGGSVMFDAATQAPGKLTTMVRRGGIDKNIPYDKNGMPTSRATAQDAANYMIDAAGGENAARTASTDLGRVIQEMADVGAPMPPLGQATQNVGLARAERGVTNTAGGVPIIDRNREVTTWAGNQLRGIAPDADPNLFASAATAQRDDLLRTAEQGVRGAEGDIANLATTRAAENEAFQTRYGGQQVPASQELDKRIVDETLVPMGAESRRLYAAADPNRASMVPAEPLVESATAVRQSLGTLNEPGKVIPQALLRRIDGGPEGEALTEVAVGDLVSVIPEITNTIRRAGNTATPNVPLLNNLRKLHQDIRGVLNQAADAGDEAALRWRTAEENYSQNYGATFGSSNPTAREFREDFNRDRPHRSETPPSQTAGRFLQKGQPEKAESLVSILERAPNAQAARAASHNFILAHAADSIVRNGTIDSAALGKFTRAWGPVIDQFPELRREFDNLVGRAHVGNLEEGRLADRLRVAQGQLRLTEEEIADSALALVSGATPSKAIAAIASSKNPEVKMQDLKRRLAGVPGADESLQRAVADWLYAKVTNKAPGMTTDEALLPASTAKLIGLTENPDLMKMLATSFGPEEMRAFRQIRKVLDLRGILSAAQGTPGSATASNLDATFRVMEAGLRTLYGGFRGGNISRNLKVGLGPIIKGRDNAVQDLVARAMVDPRIARHLLELGKTNDPKAWSSRMAKLLRREEAARQLNEDFGGENHDDEAKP